MEERIKELALEALDLHTDPRSHMMFQLDLDRAIQQVVNEEDTLDLTSIGEVVAYRDELIAEVKGAVIMIQHEEDDE